MKPPLTFFEAETLARVSLGADPWRGKNWGNGSRPFSQAMSRLKRKGFVEYTHMGDRASPAGLVALRETFENAMRRGQTIEYMGPSSSWARRGMVT